MPGVTVQCIDCAHSTRPKTADASDDHMLRAGFASCAVRFDPPGHWLAVLRPLVEPQAAFLSVRRWAE